MTAVVLTTWLLVYATVSPVGGHFYASYILTFQSFEECRGFADKLGEIGLKPERAHCLPVEVEAVR